MDCPEGKFFNAGGYLPPMTTYAQNFEDVTLRRALQDIERGFYVDVGAWHPTRDSVTRWFYDQGWRGINVEPNPHFLNLLRKERPRDVNLGCAIDGMRGKATLHVVADTGLTTIDSAVSRGLSVTRRLSVETMNLDDLLNTHQAQQIDFLKIDAEGSETAIIEAATFTEYRPRIVLVEATGLHIYNPIMESKGYRFVWFDGLNAFYVRTEDQWRAELLARPPSLWDNAKPLMQPRSLLAQLHDLALHFLHRLHHAPETWRINAVAALEMFGVADRPWLCRMDHFGVI